MIFQSEGKQSIVSYLTIRYCDIDTSLRSLVMIFIFNDNDTCIMVGDASS